MKIEKGKTFAIVFEDASSEPGPSFWDPDEMRPQQLMGCPNNSICIIMMWRHIKINISVSTFPAKGVTKGTPYILVYLPPPQIRVQKVK